LVHERDIPDLKEQKLIWEAHDEANKLILKKYNEIRNKNNEKIGGKMVEYNKGDFVWVRNFNKGPKLKIQPRFMTEPFEVIKDFGHAVLLRNHLGIITQMHKNNVRKYHSRNLELYNSLPLKTKIKLGSQFNLKELHKFFDDLNKQEDELIIRDDNPDENVDKLTPTNKTNGEVNDSESDDDSETEEMVVDVNDYVDNKSSPLTNRDIKRATKLPDLPFHMKLRERKVKFQS